MPDRLVFEVSRVRWVMMAIGLGIIGVFGFMVFFLTPGGGGIGYTLVFLLCLVLPLALSVATMIWPTALVLTSEGFSERIWRKGYSHRWDEVEVLGVLDLGHGLGRHVVFKLTDDARDRQGPLLTSIRRMGLKDYDGSIGAEYLVSPEELCGLMERWRSRAMSATAPSVDSPPHERTRAI